MSIESRQVKRVLVMLDDGEGDPASGEVFDLTALALEIGGKCDMHHGQITLKVSASRDCVSNEPLAMKTDACWRVMANFHSSGDAGHLDDAINSSMPDSFATQDLRKKLNKLQKKAEQLRGDIQLRRLMDAAAIRYQRPIARVSENPMLPLATPAREDSRPTTATTATTEVKP